LHEQGLDAGTVLDFGCGYGMDADEFGWDKYDPYYEPRDLAALGPYDTVVCTYVVSAVSEAVAESITDNIFRLLRQSGIAYFVVPRNLPKEGKLSGYAKRPQSNVVLKGEGVTSVHLVEKEFEIYAVTSPEIKLSGFFRGNTGR
jgi:2-polyprenyl-3-methyl-5-hydroxy-6-metoxy-1,4-benzoquinol methylase